MNRQPSGFVKPAAISVELAKFLGKDKSTLMPRTEVTREINKYIREGVDIDEDEIAELHQCDINLLRLWKLVNSIKMDFFCYLTPDDSLKCIVKGIIVDHEGYVMHNEYGSFKIVDRNTFSYFNFNLSPMNQKGDG